MSQIVRYISVVMLCWTLLGPASLAWSAEGKGKTNGKPNALPPIPLTLPEVLAWVDRSHPLLQGAGTEKIVARGKFLRALGAFEPTLVNDYELERLVTKDGKTVSVGFNDSFLDVRHPSGARAIGGFRAGVGPIQIADLAINGTNQPLMGFFLPLLRGFMVNADNAELQRSGLADPKAEVQIAQTRQDLFLGGASQYWDWVAAWKLADVQKRALGVAEDRAKQIEGRAKAGAVAPLDVVEANQEVQRRKENFIAAKREVEREQYKLSMFLWEKESPVTPSAERVPDFPKETPLPSVQAVEEDKVKAKLARPEVREVAIEAKLNNIDLELAKNNLLPSLNAEAEPSRKPGEFVLGLGYRFGVEMRVPFLQRRAKGEVLEAQGKADRFVLMQRFREQQAVVDVDNALSAIERAKERIAVAHQALQLARTLEQGERFRFSMGATSVLFVNLRERNAVDAENQWIRALADYQKAQAFYQWAVGNWGKAPGSAVPVSYRPIE